MRQKRHFASSSTLPIVVDVPCSYRHWTFFSTHTVCILPGGKHLYCFYFLGVDLNFAPEHILRRVAGLGEVKAKAIVEHRNKHGNFVNRQQLKKVKGIGDSIFKQCAGFVIVRRDG